jgi:hypothetical protein
MKADIEQLKKELGLTPEDLQPRDWYSPDFLFRHMWPKSTAIGRIKRVEENLSQLKRSFELLLEHLKLEPFKSEVTTPTGGERKEGYRRVKKAKKPKFYELPTDFRPRLFNQ